MAKYWDQGYLRVARLFGTTIRIHWSAPLAAILFGGFRVAPVFWASFIVLVLAHELGHAFVVRLAKAHPRSVDLTGYGGLCTWTGRVSRIQRACIAWGGVWAQLVLLILAYALRGILGAPTTAAGMDVLDVFTRSNLWMIGFNLIPLPPLDGAEAWQLFPLLRDRYRKKSRPKPKAAPTPKPKVVPAPKTARSKSSVPVTVTQEELDALVDGYVSDMKSGKDEPN